MNSNQKQNEAIEALIEAFEGDIDVSIEALKLKNEEKYKKSIRKTKIPNNNLDVLIVNNLTKKYKFGKKSIVALENISFSVKQSEFVAITGTSGSGKSTLLHLIAGLDKPTSGDVVIDNQEISKLNDKSLSNFRNINIGFVFQFFYLQPFLTLQQNVEVPAMFARKKRKIRSNRSSKIIEVVDLSDRINHLPRELSGGQMQRTAIARALQNNPKILFADEPTGNLDRKNSFAIFELLNKIRLEQGTTIIVVTHDKELAELADRIISISDGQIKQIKERII